MEVVITWIGAAVVPICTALMGILTYKIQRKDKKHDEVDQHLKKLSDKPQTIDELTKSVIQLTEETNRQAGERDESSSESFAA